MSNTKQAKPRIWEQGGIYCAEIDGKTVTSPSLEHIRQRLGLAESQAEKARAEKAAREADLQSRKDGAADQLPALEASLEKAATDLEDAWTAFVAAAVEGDGGIVGTYVRWKAAFRRHDGYRLNVAATRFEAEHGYMRVSGGNAPPDLAACLNRAAAEHEAALGDTP